MSKEALQQFQADCQAAYAAYQAKQLKLDMSRGKPAPKQLELTKGMMEILKEMIIGLKTVWTAATTVFWMVSRKQRRCWHRCWAFRQKN